MFFRFILIGCLCISLGLSIGLMMSCSSGGGDSSGSAASGSFDVDVGGPLPGTGQPGQNPGQNGGGGTSGGTVQPADPDPAPQVTNVNPPYTPTDFMHSVIDPSGATSMNQAWIAEFGKDIWKNHSCRNSTPEVFLEESFTTPGDFGSSPTWHKKHPLLISAMDDFRDSYKMYGTSSDLRDLSEVQAFSDKIQTIIIPKMESEYRNQINLAGQLYSQQSGWPQVEDRIKISYVVTRAMQQTKVSTAFPTSSDDRNRFEAAISQIATSGTHSRTNQLIYISNIHLLPLFRQSGSVSSLPNNCEPTCINFMQQALGAKYNSRWDAYINKTCKDYPASIFGVLPQELTSTAPAKISFGIRLEPAIMFLTEQKLRLQWSYDFMRYIFFKSPQQDPIAWENIFAAYYGSEDKLDALERNDSNKSIVENSDNYNYVQAIRGLKNSLKEIPYQIFSNYLSVNANDGGATLHFVGMGSTVIRDISWLPIGIVVFVFSPETIN